MATSTEVPQATDAAGDTQDPNDAARDPCWTMILKTQVTCPKVHKQMEEEGFELRSPDISSLESEVERTPQCFL